MTYECDHGKDGGYWGGCGACSPPADAPGLLMDAREQARLLWGKLYRLSDIPEDWLELVATALAGARWEGENELTPAISRAVKDDRARTRAAIEAACCHTLQVGPIFGLMRTERVVLLEAVHKALDDDDYILVRPSRTDECELGTCTETRIPGWPPLCEEHSVDFREWLAKEKLAKEKK